jgi:hypothetical protein
MFLYFSKVSHAHLLIKLPFVLQIHVGNDKCIHARIYKNLQREVSVHSIQEDKTREDAITYF